MKIKFGITWRHLVKAHHMTAIAVGLTLFAPAVADAACVQSGTVIRVLMRDASDGNKKHVIKLRRSHRSDFHYSASTTDDHIALAAMTLHAAGIRVEIKGSKSSCPTTGSSRSMGQINYLKASP